ncbi:MAG: histidine kinase [Actinomycetota bacterium]
MAIANERLRAGPCNKEGARVPARIVEAGDRERRQVERDLHDGAQQRLVTVSLALACCATVPTWTTCTALEETAAELKRAIAELRDLARGDPPGDPHGRGPDPGRGVPGRAVRPGPSAERARRAARPVEAAAYFVVSESLANVAKYAEASGAIVELARANGSLFVAVTDSVGGADPAAGSGLGGLHGTESRRSAGRSRSSERRR